MDPSIKRNELPGIQGIEKMDDLILNLSDSLRIQKQQEEPLPSTSSDFGSQVLNYSYKKDLQDYKFLSEGKTNKSLEKLILSKESKGEEEFKAAKYRMISPLQDQYLLNEDLTELIQDIGEHKSTDPHSPIEGIIENNKYFYDKFKATHYDISQQMGTRKSEIIDKSLENQIQNAFNMEEIQSKLTDIIGNYLRDISQQQQQEIFKFEDLSIQSSESLEEHEEKRVKEIEMNLVRQKIYQNIVEKISLSVIESIKSVTSSPFSSKMMGQSNALNSQNIQNSIQLSKQKSSPHQSVEHLEQIIQDQNYQIEYLKNQIRNMQSGKSKEQDHYIFTDSIRNSRDDIVILKNENPKLQEDYLALKKQFNQILQENMHLREKLSSQEI